MFNQESSSGRVVSLLHGIWNIPLSCEMGGLEKYESSFDIEDRKLFRSVYKRQTNFHVTRKNNQQEYFAFAYTVDLSTPHVLPGRLQKKNMSWISVALPNMLVCKGSFSLSCRRLYAITEDEIKRYQHVAVNVC